MGFIKGIIFFSTMDGFFIILENNLYVLFCTRLYPSFFSITIFVTCICFCALLSVYALNQKKRLTLFCFDYSSLFQIFDLNQCGALCVALFTTKVVLHTSVWASRVGHTVGGTRQFQLSAPGGSSCFNRVFARSHGPRWKVWLRNAH